MRKVIVAIVTTSCAFVSACGGSSGGGPMAAPTAPSGTSTLPPAVNVGGTQNVAWNGQAAYDGAGSSTLQLILTQSGAQVSGTISAFNHLGPFAGTVSGNTVVFNFSEGNKGTGCGNAINGTATVTDTTMTATFSGHDCQGGAVNNGTFTCALDSPLTTTRFPVGGTWKSTMPASLGGGTWTWVLSEGGDVNGGPLSGTVTVPNGNTLNLTSGSVTGTVTDNFPGPPSAVTTTFSVTFGAPCATTMTFTTGFNSVASPTGQVLTNTSFSGTTCNGALPPVGFNLLRQ